MKKLLGIVLSAAMLLSMADCGSTAASSAESSAAEDSTADAATATDAAASDLKVGVITIGDETEGYTAAHINGIKAAAQKLGMSDSQIVWKYKVPEGAECSDAAEDLVGQGCNLVVSNSYGHQTYIVEGPPPSVWSPVPRPASTRSSVRSSAAPPRPASSSR